MVKTTDKPAKHSESATKKPKKVFDVSKPGKGHAPSATARPIITTHRPMMPDPMVSPTDQPATTAAATSAPKLPPSSTKVVIKPISDGDDADAAKSSKTDTIDLNIPDFGPTEATKPEKVKTDETAEEPAPVAETEAESDSAPEPAPAETVENTEAEEPATPEPKSAEEPVQETASTTSVPASDSGDSPADEQTKSEKETAALEAEIKRQEELDKLVESKEYFLPITTAEHRRSKIVTIFGIVLILLLGLLLVNMLLDVGTITIKGVKPLTHFFSS